MARLRNRLRKLRRVMSYGAAAFASFGFREATQFFLCDLCDFAVNHLFYLFGLVGGGMISVQDLESAMESAEPLFEELQNSYALLPDTRCECEEPGVCCAFLPEMTIVEALQWIRLLTAGSDADMVETLRKFMAFYLTNPVRRAGCPFLVEGGCGVYEHRSFACRAYGMWSRKMGDARTRESREDKKALLLMWKRYGLELPPEKATFEMDYCNKVRIVSKKPMSDPRLLKILKRVYDLGDPLHDLRTRFENEYHSDISFLLTSLVLGQKKAVLGKFAVIKEIVRLGTDARLRKMLAKAARGWGRTVNC